MSNFEALVRSYINTQYLLSVKKTFKQARTCPKRTLKITPKKEHPSLPQQRRPLDNLQPPQPRLFVVVEEFLRCVVERRRAVARAARAEELVPLRPLDGLGVVALLVALHRRERRRLDDRGDARVRDVREAEVERDLLDLEGTSSARAASAEDAGGTTAAGRSVFMSS